MSMFMLPEWTYVFQFYLAISSVIFPTQKMTFDTFSAQENAYQGHAKKES